MLFACYEKIDGKKNLTTLVRWREGVATSYIVNDDCSKTFERRVKTFVFEGIGTIYRAFTLPRGTIVEPCYC